MFHSENHGGHVLGMIPFIRLFTCLPAASVLSQVWIRCPGIYGFPGRSFRRILNIPNDDPCLPSDVPHQCRHSPNFHFMFIMQRNMMLWCFISFISSGALLGAIAQTSNAVCRGSFAWAFNPRGQSPCVVSSYLQKQCGSGDYFNVPPLPQNSHYSGPASNQTSPCQCSSVTYSLLSACASCQLGTFLSWPRWSVNCSTVYFNVFPMDIPPDTEVPAWAYILDPGMDSIFNVTAARIMATNTSTPETENAIGASTAKHSVSAATAGLIGAISTLGVIICVAVVYFIWSRRFRRKSGPVQQSSYSPLYETHREASPFMVLRAHSVDGGRTTPHKVPLSSLRTSSPHRLDMTANNSLVSLPNNLYIPSPAESNSYSPAAESSHI